MAIESQITTLSNGLRIVSVPMGGVKSVVVGTWVGVGSSYETPAQNGITHFLEHMFFTGTASRTELQIAKSIESLGGKINANTGKEHTVYFTKVMDEDFAHGFNTVADIIRNSQFPPDKLERERSVVIQEIGQYADEPGEVLSDHFYATCFAGQPLGRTILGPAEVIRSLSRQDLFDYVAQHYTPGNMVVAAAGAVDHNQLVDLANSAYGDMKYVPQLIRPAPARYTGGDVRIQREMEQLQICTAFQGVGSSDRDASAHAVLAQALGGGMSKPLFQKIRSELGMVYGVGAFSASFRDTGVWGVQAGLDPVRAPEYLDALTETLRTSIDSVTEEDLQETKKCFKSGTVFGLESVYAQASRAATSLLDRGRVRTLDEALVGINAVTLADLRRVHAEIFLTKPTVAAIGNLSHLESYDKFAARFAPVPPVKNATPTDAPPTP
ncbi:MAG: pitrilysin family protein [Alphaproteobacteria bacterium]